MKLRVEMHVFYREVEIYNFATAFEYRDFILKIANLSGVFTALNELNCSIQGNGMSIVEALIDLLHS